jgi:hypothetical protein
MVRWTSNRDYYVTKYWRWQGHKSHKEKNKTEPFDSKDAVLNFKPEELGLQNSIQNKKSKIPSRADNQGLGRNRGARKRYKSLTSHKTMLKDWKTAFLQQRQDIRARVYTMQHFHSTDVVEVKKSLKCVY